MNRPPARTVPLIAYWQDARHLMRENRDVLIPVAGLLLLLPILLTTHFIEIPVIPDNATAEETYTALNSFLSDYGFLFFVLQIVWAYGLFLIYALFVGRGGRTVGERLLAATGLFPGYFIASLITGVGVSLGFYLLIVPAIYLMVRFSLMPAVVVARQIRNPLAIMIESWKATSGLMLRIFAMTAVLLIVGFVLLIVLSIVLGLISILVFGPEGWEFLSLAIVWTALVALMVVLAAVLAAFYRQSAAAVTTD